jgi:hypothetical protein
MRVNGIENGWVTHRGRCQSKDRREPKTIGTQIQKIVRKPHEKTRVGEITMMAAMIVNLFGASGSAKTLCLVCFFVRHRWCNNGKHVRLGLLPVIFDGNGLLGVRA